MNQGAVLFDFWCSTWIHAWNSPNIIEAEDSRIILKYFAWSPNSVILAESWGLAVEFQAILEYWKYLTDLSLNIPTQEWTWSLLHGSKLLPFWHKLGAMQLISGLVLSLGTQEFFMHSRPGKSTVEVQNFWVKIRRRVIRPLTCPQTIGHSYLSWSVQWNWYYVDSCFGIVSYCLVCS